MYYVGEDMVTELVAQRDVTPAIRDVYKAMASGEAVNFPVVRQALGHADAIFGFKSGFDRTGPALGVKAGGLWPANQARGLANHQSTIMLFDCDSGAPEALVRGTWLTGLRTAAASAISIAELARADARTLSIIGAGGQAMFQLKAAMATRPFSRVLLHGPTEAKLSDLAGRLARHCETHLEERPVEIAAPGLETTVGQADVMITVTPSFAPIVKSEWVRPGTHIACMGADTRGKQECEAALLARADIFVDDVAQAVAIGECQHAFAQGMIEKSDLTPIGAVLNGAAPGRRSEEAITIFDSTGVGLQDIAAARIALSRALAAGRAVELA